MLTVEKNEKKNKEAWNGPLFFGFIYKSVIYRLVKLCGIGP